MFYSYIKVLLISFLISSVGCFNNNINTITPESYVTSTEELFDSGQDSDDLLIEALDYLEGRDIRLIVVHCAAIPKGLNPDKEWYNRVWELNDWNNPGYHIVVREGGDLIWMQPFNKPSNGAKGHNLHALHICYNGGVDIDFNPLDTRTDQQKIVLSSLIQVLQEVYPEAEVKLHNELTNKACPSFYEVDDIFTY